MARTQEQIDQVKELAGKVLMGVHLSMPGILEGTEFTEQELLWALVLMTQKAAGKMQVGENPW